ncbi:MAG TPA: hypothetical protein VFE68_05565 [Vicinamibacteria bacterium]|nr:hypothetical protein [Vicinamibacteria bacterium]
MAAATSKKKTKTAARPAPHKKAEARPAAKEKDKAAARPVAKVAPPARAAAPVPAPAGKGAPAAKPAPAQKAGAMPPRPVAPTGRPGAPGKPGDRPKGKKGGRKSPLSQRRGPNGELFTPGDLLLPTGPQGPDEIQYLLRGAVAAEHTAGPTAVSEIITKKGTPDAEGDRGELTRFSEGLGDRFEKGAIEPLLPIRPTSKRNFQGVVERAKHRRREIGAFLRGLDLGRTETSHMDSHGEASLQSLMEWAARLENLAEADEPDQADYAQFHRGLDQLENTTEALIVDVELTLRRLRDRAKA